MFQNYTELLPLIKASYASWYGIKLFWACCECRAENAPVLHRSARAVLLALMARTFRVDRDDPTGKPASQPLRERDLFNYPYWCGMTTRSVLNGMTELRRLGIVRKIPKPDDAIDPILDAEGQAEMVDEYRFADLMGVPLRVVERRMLNPNHDILGLVTDTRTDPRTDLKGVALDVARFLGYVTKPDGTLEITNTRIARALGVTDRAVKKAMKGLMDEKVLRRTRRGTHNRVTKQGVASAYNVDFLALARHIYGDIALAVAAENADKESLEITFPRLRLVQ